MVLAGHTTELWAAAYCRSIHFELSTHEFVMSWASETNEWRWCTVHTVCSLRWWSLRRYSRVVPITPVPLPEVERCVDRVSFHFCFLGPLSSVQHPISTRTSLALGIPSLPATSSQ